MTWQEYTAGCAAGAANVISGFPFDTVKVRMQASPTRYSAWECFLHICRQEGVRAATSTTTTCMTCQPQPPALFRGLSPPLVGGAIETGINYAVYASILRTLSVRQPAVCRTHPHSCRMARPHPHCRTLAPLQLRRGLLSAWFSPP